SKILILQNLQDNVADCSWRRFDYYQRRVQELGELGLKQPTHYFALATLRHNVLILLSLQSLRLTLDESTKAHRDFIFPPTLRSFALECLDKGGLDGGH